MYLSKHKNGYYYIYFTDVYDKRKSNSTKTKYKKEETEVFHEFKTEYDYLKKNKLVAISINTFFNNFLKYSEGIHSINNTKSLAITFKAFIKLLSVNATLDLRQNNIMIFRDLRLRTLSPYTVKRDLANLSSAFTWGIQMYYCKFNPCIGVKRPVIPERIPAYFSKEEFSKLISSLGNEALKDLIIFAVNTGLPKLN